MVDLRFDRLYILKIKEGEIDRLKQLCDDYHILDNGVFEHATNFHRIWGIGPQGMIYLSCGMAKKVFDFNSIEELEKYLEKFELIN